LTATGTLSPAAVLAGAVLGAVLGDALSYWLGRRFGGSLAGVWPFTRNPGLLPRGVGFFRKWGGLSVFIGRFFGPLRAVVPLAAGIMQMPSGRFWIANVASALVWAPMLMLVGDWIGRLGGRLIGTANIVALVLAGTVLLGVAGFVWAVLRSGRKGA
jgi:membrane protein DedA with SNARE-associated domain